MAGFLYFAPSWDNDTKRAIGYAFEGSPSRREVIRGPNGARGVVLGAPSLDVGFYPDRQKWRQLPAASIEDGVERFVIFDPLDLPGPEQLERHKMLRGEVVELKGAPWQIPYAHKFEDLGTGYPVHTHVLSRYFRYGDDGKWAQGEIVEEYAPLWSAAMSYWEQWLPQIPLEPGESVEVDLEAERPTLTFSELMDRAVVGLQANYRIGPVETCILNLLTSDTAHEILHVMVDFKTLTQFKKKQFEDTSTDSGKSAETPSLLQPLAS